MENVTCRDCVFFQPLSEDVLQRRMKAIAHEDRPPGGGECHCHAPTSVAAVGWPLVPVDGWCGDGVPDIDAAAPSRHEDHAESVAEGEEIYDARVRFEREIEQFNRVVATLKFPDNEEEPPPEEPPPALHEEGHAHLHLVPDPLIDREDAVPDEPPTSLADPDAAEQARSTAESSG